MQEAEEQDTCRICSAPAEPDQPLFHPCKCSGTIRYIHQDCLTTWLSHSKKKTCDVCKHPYAFTKVYAQDMPSRLPLVLLIRRLAQQAFYLLLFMFRAISVATIWLAVLPWATVWTWRMYFAMGESTAWWISNRTRTTDTHEAINPFYANLSAPSSVPPSDSLLVRVAYHPAWVALSADIFAGQIIASVIVLTFVAIFLLREWISQNARPGVFDDEDPPAEDRAQEPVARVQARVQQPLVNENDAARLARRQFEALQALDALRAREGTHGHLVGEGRNHGRTALDILPVPKGKVSANGDETDRFAIARARRRHERSLVETQAEEEHDEQQSLRRRSFHRRRNRKKDLPPPTLAERAAQSNYEFTFRAESPISTSRSQRSTSEAPSERSNRSLSTLSDSSSSSGSIFPTVILEPPRDSIPFSLTPFTLSANLAHDDDTTPLLPTSIPLPPSRPPTPAPSSPISLPPPAPPQPSSPIRRPPLPPAIPLTPGSSTTSPLDSPSLATYQAPEELGSPQNDAGPSNFAGYFGEIADGEVEDDEETLEDDTLEGERDRYFPEIADEDPHVAMQNAMMHLMVERIIEDEDEEDEEEDDVNWEGVALDDDDADELHEPVMDEAVAIAVEPVDVAQPQNGPPALAQAAAALRQAADQVGQQIPEAVENEDIEGNVEDDMEGAMEAIGMRGPIYGVLQNAALMVFVLDTALGLGIWIPFTIGKSTALLSLDPPRLLEILHFPIRAIRVLTDPIVDIVVYVFVELFLPPYIRLGRNFAHFFGRLLLLGIDRSFGEANANKTSELAAVAYSYALNFSAKPMEYLASLTTSSNIPSPAPSTTSTWLNRAVYTAVEVAEPYFANLGKEVRLTSSQLKTTYIDLALGSTPKDKLFAVFLGYNVVAFALALYLNLLTIGNARNAGRAVRSAVRQQLLVLKVATFIVIELVIFPLCCGIILDMSTIWLFRETTVAARLDYFYQTPLTAMFYHWVAGTLFMYCFAVLLAACRSIMRPGAMWFIKDPQDQNSHPIRDIIDRPTLTQLRKICVSGVMYAVVVLLVVASLGGLLILGNKSVMPIRWKNREPLSNVPIDLLFLHLVLPYTMHYFRPRKALKKIASSAWKFFAHCLRLSSYFFGGRDATEESSRVGWNYFNRNPECVRDGSFRRVPATDHIALPRDMRATAAVDEHGEAVDDAARQLMMRQNTEVIKAKRDIQKDYMVVYIPPFFGTRVVLFLSCMWVLASISLGLLVALPILIGRSFFKLFVSYDVHDGYSLIAGFYLLWGCFIVGKAVDRLDKRRQRRGAEGPRADLRILVLKRGLLWIAKISYMIVFLGVVVPTLVSLVVDLYIILPIRFITTPDLKPRIRVVDSWALGLLYVKIGLYAHRLPGQRHLQHPIFTGIQQIIRNGWTHPDPITATKEVIAPLTGGLLAMILLPGLAFVGIRQFLPMLPLDNKFLFIRVYPLIFAVASFSRSSMVLADMFSTWSQSVRDKEFLVEMRLRNHESEAKQVEQTPVQSSDNGTADLN